METPVISYYAGRQNRDMVTAARQAIIRDWWDHTRVWGITPARGRTFRPMKGSFDTFIMKSGQHLQTHHCPDILAMSYNSPGITLQ